MNDLQMAKESKGNNSPSIGFFPSVWVIATETYGNKQLNHLWHMSQALQLSIKYLYFFSPILILVNKDG